MKLSVCNPSLEEPRETTKVLSTALGFICVCTKLPYYESSNALAGIDYDTNQLPPPRPGDAKDWTRTFSMQSTSLKAAIVLLISHGFFPKMKIYCTLDIFFVCLTFFILTAHI